MKCYYEELGCARDANDGDIKTAYRKLALRWHPDKNLDCLEEAKERFQLIQQAYEVLSDPHERSWYDNHREQILRGKNSDYDATCLDVFQYFTVSCFKGYGDDSNGFYAVYREVFEKLAAEDAEFMEDEEEVAQIPSFGNSQSSYEEVVGPFYAYWQAYCTKKTYSWLCPYDVQEIKDRRILREIDKEMKKIVQKAKKERNEEVRNLVSFIRKRDRRVHAYRQQLEERAALNRQKQEQNRLDQIRKRQKELEEMRQNSSHTLNDGYEEQLRQLEQHYGGESSAEEEESDENEGDNSTDDQEEEDDYVDDLYCVACNKTFKNANAFTNHETSKKHRETVERMKREMEAEEEAFKADEEDELVDSETEEKVDKINTLSGDEPEKTEDIVETPEEDEESATPATSGRKNKKNKKSKKANKPVLNDLPDNSDVEEEITQMKIKDNSDEDDWKNTSKKGARKNKNKKQTKQTTDQAAPSVKESTTESSKEMTNSEMNSPTATASKTATQMNADSTGPTTHVCVTCKNSFPSKNKLFAHLKITNHGVYIPKPKPEPTTDSKSKKGNKAKRK